MNRRQVYLIVYVVATGLMACATSMSGRWQQLLKAGDYPGAIAALQEARTKRPDDPRLLQDLGDAYRRNDQLDSAIVILQQAKRLDPKDSKTVFLLGMTYEQKGDFASALKEYGTYVRFGRFGGMRGKIQERILVLIRRQIQQEVQQAMAQEAAIEVAAIPETSIAVLYFKNIGEKRELDPLQKGIAEMIITDLSKAHGLKIVERVKLQKLLEEMGLGQTGLVDETTAPRVGKLLGANKVVSGAFTDLALEQMRIDAALSTLKTGEIKHPEPIVGGLQQLFTLEKQIVFGVIDDLGMTLTPEERDAIHKVPTENFLAFLAYSRGLDYADQGRYTEAMTEFQQATTLDPNFTLAQQSAAEVQTISSAEVVTVEQLEVAFASEEQQEAKEEEAPPAVTVNTAERLRDVGTQIATGAVPTGEGQVIAVGATDTPPTTLQPATVTVHVEGYLP